MQEKTEKGSCDVLPGWEVSGLHWMMQVYESFLKGDVTVDVFVPQYVKARSLFHQRELKKQAAQQTL